MRRLAAIDWLLLGTTLPIILIGLVMTVVCGIRGDFVIAPFLATSAADEQSYPVVARILPSPSAEANPLAVGDQLLHLEGSDLRGASNFEVILRWSQAAQAGARAVQLTIERGGVPSDARVSLIPGNNFLSIDPPWWAPLAFIVADVCTALILLMRAGHWHLARRHYVVSMLVAFWYMPYFTIPTAPRVEVFSDVVFLALGHGLLLWNLNEFVPGVRLWGRAQQALAWTLGFLVSASMAAVFFMPDVGLSSVSMCGLSLLGFVIAWFVALMRGYRRADAPGRRQIKWVVYGFCVAKLSQALWASSMGVGSDWLGALGTVSYIAQVAMPFGLLVAIAYYQFLDIDRLFSATLSFSILAVVGVAMVIGVMPVAAHTASHVLGLDPATGQLLMSLGLAAVLVPAYRVVRPWIDRWFFPERATLQQGFEQLLGEISSTADLQELTQLVGERLDALLRPALIVLYTRAGDLFRPLAARGRSAPPDFAARSALIAALQERTTPLAAQRWTARRTTSLTPFERAAIETLDVAVLVPIRRGADLTAFWCLGPKRSGDIYTPTDLALLGAVAGTLSDRLLALGEARTTGQPSPAPLDKEEEELARVNGVSETQRTLQPETSNPSTGLGAGPSTGLRTSEQPATNLFRREGHFWTIDYAGSVARLKDTKGLQYLAHLLYNPQQQFLALDLMMQVSGAGAAPQVSGAGSQALVPSAPDTRDVGSVLDAQAKADYRLRLTELREELQEAETCNDSGRATQARAEIEMLSDQLAAAVGLGGRDRVTGSAAERARSTVTKGIKSAITAIRAAHPSAGRYLARTVRTGYFCAYEPDPDDPSSWAF